MLMMARREGETILIGDDIEVVIAHIGRSHVRVGMRAPKELTVMVREVKLVRDENLAASARSDKALTRLLTHLRPAASSPPGSGR